MTQSGGRRGLKTLFLSNSLSFSKKLGEGGSGGFETPSPSPSAGPVKSQESEAVRLEGLLSFNSKLSFLIGMFICRKKMILKITRYSSFSANIQLWSCAANKTITIIGSHLRAGKRRSAVL